MSLDTGTLFALLAGSARRRIVALLADGGELCVCDITAALGLAQPRVSSHLALLRKAGIVRARRQGLWVHYRLHPRLPEWAREVIDGLARGCREEAPCRDDAARLARRRAAAGAG